MTAAMSKKSMKKAAAPAATRTASLADEAHVVACSPPPGLSLPGPAVCEVHVSGVPHNLLTPMMVEAILHQAALFDDVVVGFSILRKSPTPLVISFSCEVAARCCAAHFEGCQWGESPGAEVVMLETPAAIAARAAKLEATIAFQQDVCVAFMSEGDSTDAPSEGFASSLSADAPVWEPPSRLASGTTRLTASAPAFVPAALKSPAGLKPYMSETSTELGESEDESPTSGASSPIAAQ